MRTSYSDRETFSKHTCEIIAGIDGVLMAEERYKMYNLPQYYVAINSWLLLMEDCDCHEAAIALGNYMKKAGLIATIKLASSTADYMIAIANGDRSTTVDSDIIALESVMSCDLRIALQVLRFLKRFTPRSDSLLAVAAAGFLEIQERLNWRKHVVPSRDTTPCELPPYDRVILDRMVPIFRAILGNWEFFYKMTSGHFSNGNCADAKCLAEKLDALSRYQTNLDWEYYPIKPVPQLSCELFAAKTLEVIAVPKNFKQGRLIAPEPAYVNWHANHLLDALIMCASSTEFWRYINTKDQTRQQDVAFLASHDGGVATIDSSSASDSISRFNMRYILTNALPGLWELIIPWLPRKYKVNGRTVTASTFLTSGNPITFIMETIFFFAAAMAARSIHYEHTGELGRFPTSFGDDLEVDTCYIDEVLMVLDRLGIKVNAEKTFSAGFYRESCGVEYLKGEPMKSSYWPRAQVLVAQDEAATDYAHLVDLQHRMYVHPRVRVFLDDIVSYYWPHTTHSSPTLIGSGVDEYQDLWGMQLGLKRKQHPIGAYWREDPGVTDYKDDYGYNVGHTRVVPKAITSEQRFPDLWERVTSEASVEMYMYQQWLKTGPMYESPQDELFGIVSPRSLDGVYGHPKLTIKITY